MRIRLMCPAARAALTSVHPNAGKSTKSCQKQPPINANEAFNQNDAFMISNIDDIGNFFGAKQFSLLESSGSSALFVHTNC